MEDVGLTTKSCARCKEEKPLEGFGIYRRKGKEFPMSYCRVCEHNRAVAYKNAWWALLVSTVELKCSKCGYDKHSAALDFHHVGDDKEVQISHLLRCTITPERIERLKTELAKCVVLCANCHREHHASTNFLEE